MMRKQRRVLALFDADPDQITALKNGTVQALIAQQPYLQGVDGVQQSVNAINGKKTKSILTGLAVLTNANLKADGNLYETKSKFTRESPTVLPITALGS